MQFNLINNFEDDYFKYKYKNNLDNFKINFEEKDYLFLLNRYSRNFNNTKNNLNNFELFDFLYSKNLFDVVNNSLQNDLFYLNCRYKKEYSDFVIYKAKKFSLYSLLNNITNQECNQYMKYIYEKIDLDNKEEKMKLLIETSITHKNIFATDFFIRKSLSENINLSNETVISMFFNHNFNTSNLDVLYNVINENKNHANCFFNDFHYFHNDNNSLIINSYLFKKDEFQKFFNFVEKNKIELNLNIDALKNKSKRKI